jgi:hypothetical protein
VRNRQKEWAVLQRSAGEHTQPTLRHCLNDADGLQVSKLKHAARGLNCNGDLSGAAVFRPRAKAFPITRLSRLMDASIRARRLY